MPVIPREHRVGLFVADYLLGLNIDTSFRPTWYWKPSNGSLFSPARCSSVRASVSYASLVVSDGFIEQPGAEPEGLPGPESNAINESEPFGVERICHCLTESGHGQDLITTLFTAVQQHAGSDRLADDATALLVLW